MDYDADTIDEAVLALLVLTVHQENEFGAHAWKEHDLGNAQLAAQQGISLVIQFPRRSRSWLRRKVWRGAMNCSQSCSQETQRGLASLGRNQRKKVSSRFGRIRSLFANDLLFTTKARIP